MDTQKGKIKDKKKPSTAQLITKEEGFSEELQLSFLQFVFPQRLNVGDCTIKENSVLTYYSDGSYSYSATTMSTDTNDEWGYKLILRDINQGEIYKLPPYADHSYFHMDDSNNWYSWTDNRTNIPDPRGAAIFNNIHFANYECSC